MAQGEGGEVAAGMTPKLLTGAVGSPRFNSLRRNSEERAGGGWRYDGRSGPRLVEVQTVSIYITYIIYIYAHTLVFCIDMST